MSEATLIAPRIFIAIGLPGSGKSTWCAERGIAPLSSDHMRLLLSGDEDNQRIHAEVFEAIRALLELRLRIGQAVSYVDATHLQRAHRAPYFGLAEQYGASVEALWFDVPLATCLVRNQARSRNVTAEVMEQMAAAIEPPTLDEGFSKITRVALEVSR